MRSLAQMLVDMAEIAPEAGSPRDGVRVRLDEMLVELPVEGRLRGGEMVTSAPRGRLRTGFEVPHGRIRARFVVEPV